MLSQKESAVMRVLLKLCAWVGKAYVFPSQMTIVSKSAKWCGVRMSRRTLNRVLGSLESSSYFQRTRRHQRSSSGNLVFHSTLYKLQSRAFNEVAASGAWAAKFFRVFRVPKMAQYRQSATAGYLSPVDKRVESGRAWEEGAARSGPINLTFRTI